MDRIYSVWKGVNVTATYFTNCISVWKGVNVTATYFTNWLTFAVIPFFVVEMCCSNIHSFSTANCYLALIYRLKLVN